MLIHTAHEFKAAAEHFRRVRDTVTSYDELRRRVKSVTTSHGDEAIELRPVPTLIFGSGSKRVRKTVAARLRFLARSRGLRPVVHRGLPRLRRGHDPVR